LKDELQKGASFASGRCDTSAGLSNVRFRGGGMRGKKNEKFRKKDE